MEAVLVALGALAASVWIGVPLVRGPRRDLPGSADAQQDAEARKRAALEGLLDIEGERAAGKLSEEDFHALRQEYETEAISALEELDALGRGTLGGDVETEIARIRAQLQCPRCGGTRAEDGRCTRCGTAP